MQIRRLDSFTRLTTALFLDFDGTLTQIVARPEEVRVAPGVLSNLARLFAVLDGALAIVTGRQIVCIDKFLAPHVFPTSGVHGFETRIQSGTIETLPFDARALAAAKRSLERFAAQYNGLFVERKPASIALHYRARPELAELCASTALSIIPKWVGLHILTGKMVVEIKAHDGTKGKAIASFMDTAPFKDRVPVFVGDDVTDEDAFVETNQRGGLSIKVGDGITAAQHRLRNTQAVEGLLAGLADQFEQQMQSGEVTI